MNIASQYASQDDLGWFSKWLFTLEDAIRVNSRVDAFIRFLAAGEPRWLRVAVKTVFTVPFVQSLLVFFPAVWVSYTIIYVIGAWFGLVRERRHREPEPVWQCVIVIMAFIITMTGAPFVPYDWLAYPALAYVTAYLWFADHMNELEHSLAHAHTRCTATRCQLHKRLIGFPPVGLLSRFANCVATSMPSESYRSYRSQTSVASV